MNKHDYPQPFSNLNRLVGTTALAAALTLGSTANADEALADLVEQVAPSVVTILAERTGPQMSEGLVGPQTSEPAPFQEFFRRFGMPEGAPDNPRRALPGPALGSGFILESGGLIVTNQHVVHDASTIMVRLADGREYKANLIGQDAQTDLALLSIDAEEALPFVELGDSDDIRVGEDVAAVGNPFGLGGTVTSGIVSAKGRSVGRGPYAEFLQTDAAINRGNSGGPLFNMEGDVVGVNSSIFSPTGGNVGIGFAVTSNIVEMIVEDLRDDGRVDRGWLGVSIQTVTPELAASLGMEEARGALVSSVVENGPAEDTIMVGDVITAFNGNEVGESRELPKLVAAAGIGTDATVEVFRAGDRKELRLEIGQFETAEIAIEDREKASARTLGVTVSPLTETARSEIGLEEEAVGVVVTSLAPSGPAARAGLMVGDVIVRFGDEEIVTPATLKDAVQEGEASPELVLINRRGQQIFVAIELA